MGLIIRIAWRNLWRNPRRSIILVSAIVICISALLLTLSYINGVLRQMVQSTIDFHIGEMEIYKKGFKDDHNPEKYIKDPAELYERIQESQGVKAYAPRVEGRGLIASSYASSGVQIIGIDPAREGKITLVKRSVIKGDYLEKDEDHVILIGDKMARKLKVDLGGKVVITVQTINDELASDAYRVTGIFKTISGDFDKYMVYIPIRMATKLLEMESGVTGIALRMKNMEAARVLQVMVNREFGNQDVEALTWGELEPMILEIVNISKQWNFVFFGAIFIILSIGIINTQNIAVYERMHELGILKAMGTKPFFIFSMVMMETLFLGIVGLAAGFFITYPIILYFENEGLNLAVFSEGLQQFGLGSTIFFDLEFTDIIYCAVSILVTAFFGAVIPALKAGRLEPVKAIRRI